MFQLGCKSKGKKIGSNIEQNPVSALREVRRFLRAMPCPVGWLFISYFSLFYSIIKALKYFVALESKRNRVTAFYNQHGQAVLKAIIFAEWLLFYKAESHLFIEPAWFCIGYKRIRGPEAMTCDCSSQCRSIVRSPGFAGRNCICSSAGMDHQGSGGETFFNNNTPSNCFASIILFELFRSMNVSFTTIFLCSQSVPFTLLAGILR